MSTALRTARPVAPTHGRALARPLASRAAAAVAGLVAAALLVLCSPAGDARAAETPAPAGPTSAVTWGVRPADTEHGTDRPNYAYDLDPGAGLSDGLIVSNYAETPQSYRVYAADGFLTETGQLDLLPAGEESTELGSWVSFEAQEVTVPAGESVTVPFRIDIPAGTTPGDYAAGVVSSVLVANDGGVAVDRRLGSRMFVRVTGDLAPALSIDGLAVAYEGGINPFVPGTATVTFSVTNVGNTRLSADRAVSVSGPWGLLGTTASVEAANAVPELLPGSSTSHSIVVENVWPLFVATAQVEVEGAVVSAATGLAAADPTSVPAVETETATAGAAAVPWGALVILVLLIGVVVLLRVRSRRRRSREDDRVAAAVAAALSDADAAAAPEESVSTKA